MKAVADILSAVVIPLPSFLFTLLICFDTGAKNTWRSAGGGKHADSSARLAKDAPGISASGASASPPTPTALLRQGHARPRICCTSAAAIFIRLCRFDGGGGLRQRSVLASAGAAKAARPAADLRGEAVSRC